jgi:hypothetical protein
MPVQSYILEVRVPEEILIEQCVTWMGLRMERVLCVHHP